MALGSRSGVSSHYCNPFVLVCNSDTCKTHSSVYGFNLLWSGSHTTVVEAGPYSSTRIVSGIQPEGFSWTLAPGESFDTPEAVLTWSDTGFDGLSAQMHALVRSHVVPQRWARAPRPILVNNWEATYFDFTEKKLGALAGAAADVGAELFVLDDGWFGRRTNDSRGLGDFDVNQQRLPHGLDVLARRLSARGLSFVLWVEPEMVSEDSALFEAHPDWILASPGVPPSKGRHQWVLDLSRTDVQDHLIGALTELVGSAPIAYVKWDTNRHHTDRWSASLVEQGRLDTAWTLGLYRVIDAVVRAHPDVLFESCASGGNRVDLGMLAHTPQVWLSDDTDAWERARIQTGASFGYPQSVRGSHASAVPNHQTLHVSPLKARFDVVAFGLLGYELDLSALSPAERRAVAAQIAFYREHRELLQYGRWRHMRAPFDGEECAGMIVSQDQSAAAVMEMVGRVTPNSHEEPLVLRGLNPGWRYRVSTRVESLDPRIFGSLMNEALPVKVNPDGALIRTVTRHRLLATEAFSVEVAGDLLMSAGCDSRSASPVPAGRRVCALCRTIRPGFICLSACKRSAAQWWVEQGSWRPTRRRPLLSLCLCPLFRTQFLGAGVPLIPLLLW